MDAPTSTPAQEREGQQQQPIELPVVSERLDSQEASDHAPTPSLSQQEAEVRHALATEPFQPILKVIADLERDNTKSAFPAARLVGIYRRLWESCVSKHIDSQKLELSNRILKEDGRQLKEKRDGLQLRHDKQLSRLRFFEQALQSSRDRLIRVLDDWNHPASLNPTGPSNVAREE